MLVMEMVALITIGFFLISLSGLLLFFVLKNMSAIRSIEREKARLEKIEQEKIKQALRKTREELFNFVGRYKQC